MDLVCPEESFGALGDYTDCSRHMEEMLEENRVHSAGGMPFPPEVWVLVKAGEREPVSSTGWQLCDSVSGPNEVINIKQIKAS